MHNLQESINLIFRTHLFLLLEIFQPLLKSRIIKYEFMPMLVQYYTPIETRPYDCNIDPIL